MFWGSLLVGTSYATTPLQSVTFGMILDLLAGIPSALPADHPLRDGDRVDVLRPLRVEIPLASLLPDLNDYGRCALLLPANSAVGCALPAKQGLRLGSYAGSIDGKEKINLVIERLYDGDRVDASWSREADGQYRRLQGRVQRDGKAKLFETAAGSEELQVEFTLFGKADGSFDGQWRSISGGAALKSLELKVLR